jgi:hypothetical protein
MPTSIPTTPSPTNITKVLSLLEETPQKLAAFTAMLTEEQAKDPLAPNERSLVENVAHLLNTEASSTMSILLALMLDAPLLHNYHPERHYGKIVCYEQFPLSELIPYFAFRRKVLLSILCGLNEAQWARTVREEGKQRQESVYWRCRALALHEEEHLLDIEAKLGK